MKDIFKDPFIQKTMKDFVENMGKAFLDQEEPIPIKKTLTHIELQKII